MSKFAPNIEMELTKEQVLDISCNEDVTQIYAAEEIPIAISDESYSTVCFENTGIKSLNEGGITGEGVKIGVYDKGSLKIAGTPAPSSCLPSNNIEVYNNNSCLQTEYENEEHGNKVACVLVGRQDNYCGVAPDAELYYIDIYAGVGGHKQNIEWLIAQGVNVINISMSLSLNPYASDTQNQYNDLSKWLDHVSYQDNVTIVMSAGNAGSSGIWSGNMGYNVITVGAYADWNTPTISDDELRSDSGYNSANTSNCVSTYKPDIIAPGNEIHIPISNSSFNGTSAATPFVTGSIALLMEIDPYLKTRPDLVKALIMVGADTEKFITMSSPNTSTPTESALSRRYGAGALNVQNSLSCLSTTSYPKYFVGQDSTLQTTKTVNVPYGTDLLRVALCYSKCNYYSDGASHTSSLNNSFMQISLPTVSLKVTAPDGTYWYCKSEGNNVQMLSMDVSDCPKGTYTITIFRSGPPTGNTYYSIAVLNGGMLI